MTIDDDSAGRAFFGCGKVGGPADVGLLGQDILIHFNCSTFYCSRMSTISCVRSRLVESVVLVKVIGVRGIIDGK